MTIREKITSLGLNPKQTIEITLLLTECHTIGFENGVQTVCPDANYDSLAFVNAKMAMQVLDHKHDPAPMPPNNAIFSSVFGIDLTNELP